MGSDAFDDETPMPSEEDVRAVFRLAPERDEDEDRLARFDTELTQMAQMAPRVVAAAAGRALGGNDRQLQVAAIYAFGRAAEAADDELRAEIERILVGRGDLDREREREAVATALLHVWGVDDDDTFTVERRYARSSSAALRMAAAMSLALSTPVPLPGFLLSTMRGLAADPQPEVRSWANFALDQ